MNELPGLYLSAGSRVHAPGCRRISGFEVRAVPGALVSVSKTQGIWLGVDGILTGIERNRGETDADTALRLYQGGGIEALRDLSGYYTLLLVVQDSGRAWVIPDLLATRPYYITACKGNIVTGPDASYPRRLGLLMSVDRQVLYQMFRINHPLEGRCLASEIERTRPFTSYQFSADGGITRLTPSRIEQNPDLGISLDTAADSMHEASANAVAAILEHPIARSRELELPLTAGFDSRHLLGELFNLGRPPDRIRHVRVDESDYAPVEIICRDLGMKLHAPRFERLDHAALIRRWLHGSAGQVHLHQIYLFGLGAEAESRPVLGLTAVLSGLLFSYAPLGTPLHRRHYTRTGLGLLFPDRTRLAREFAESIDSEYSLFKGEPAFRKIAADAINRSPRYAGAPFAEMGESAIYFPPAADRGTWKWFCGMPASLAWRQKARIRLFERYFPELGLYPTTNGFPLVGSRPRGHFQATLRTARGPGGRARGLVPPNPHAWLRAHPVLRNLSERVVMESKLCRDGHIPQAAGTALWNTFRLGAQNGWALMSLATTEASYRILILGEDPGAVAEWMTG